MYGGDVAEPIATVTIVEDEAILAQLLEFDLRRLGYRVLGVHSTGEAALEAAAREPPDLALMDITLQGQLDGIETARRLHERHGVPCIFLTAHSDADTVGRATEAEPFAYLRKPYNDKDLELALAVTMRKLKAEAKRERRLQLLQHALEGLPGTAVVVCDEGGRVALLNSDAERLTGWRAADATGRPFSEVCELWDAEGRRREIDVTAIDRDELESIPLLIRPREGDGSVPIRAVLSRAKGSPALMVAIHRHSVVAAEPDEEVVVLCGWCRLVLDAGAWVRLETYLAQQGKRVSHGMCEGCLVKFTGPFLAHD